MARIQTPLEVHELSSIIEDGLDVHEKTVREILLEGLLVLKKIELHLSMLNNTELTDRDVGG